MNELPAIIAVRRVTWVKFVSMPTSPTVIYNQSSVFVIDPLYSLPPFHFLHTILLYSDATTIHVHDGDAYGDDVLQMSIRILVDTSIHVLPSIRKKDETTNEDDVYAMIPF